MYDGRELQFKTAIELPTEEIADFCRRWNITELCVFGPVLCDDFTAESDIDILIRYPENWPHGLFEWEQMRGKLRQMLGREVDLTSAPGLERSQNTRRRDTILRSAKVVYHAALHDFLVRIGNASSDIDVSCGMPNLVSGTSAADYANDLV